MNQQMALCAVKACGLIMIDLYPLYPLYPL